MEGRLVKSFVLAISLTLLIGSYCKPLQLSRRSTDSEQPARCGLTRPRSSSTSECATKEIRFFLHPTISKGCKKFGICKEDSDFYDNRTHLNIDNYFESIDECQKECMQYVTCPELVVSENDHVQIVSNNGWQGWGRKVTYECNEGYSFPENTERKEKICLKNGSWSGDAPVCLRQCQEPSPVQHALIAPAKRYHDQGSTIHYTCGMGYNLTGNRQRTCGPNGWSGQEPQCLCPVTSTNGACPTCPEPSPIEHGQVIAPSRFLDAVVEYRCDHEYVLIGNGTRTCEVGGQWTGEEPVCWKLTIFKEESNDNIGMDVTNKTVILSIQSTNIKFRAMSSTPNPFLNKMEPEWIFSKTGTLPHAVQQSSYMLTFDSILRSREQEGTYTITFGNYTASFTLHTRVDSDKVYTEPSILYGGPRIPPPSEGAVLECVVMGCPIPNLKWYHNDEEIFPDDERIRMSNTFVHNDLVVGLLTIDSLSANDSGSYWCVANNSLGERPSIPYELRLPQARRKRSIEDSETDPSLCDSNSELVTLRGQVKREIRKTHSPLTTKYQVQVDKFLSGSDLRDSASKLRIIVVNTEPDKERLALNTDYIFKGKLLNKRTFLVSRQSIHRYTQELENHIKSC